MQRLSRCCPIRGEGGLEGSIAPPLNAISWRLHTGAPWRDIPERYGPWQTAYDRFMRWRRDGGADPLLWLSHSLCASRTDVDGRGSDAYLSSSGGAHEMRKSH
ncbi:transposase [Archangium primigenium]|nr:transposase [Archangium primigenium]